MEQTEEQRKALEEIKSNLQALMDCTQGVVVTHEDKTSYNLTLVLQTIIVDMQKLCKQIDILKGVDHADKKRKIDEEME